MYNTENNGDVTIDMNDPFLTPAGVEQKTGINKQRVQRWIDAGLFGHKDENDNRFVNESELDLVTKIATYMDNTPGATIKKVREMLLKENLLEDHQENKEIAKIEQALENIGLIKSVEFLNRTMQEFKSDIRLELEQFKREIAATIIDEIKSEMSEQKKLIESESTIQAKDQEIERLKTENEQREKEFALTMTKYAEMIRENERLKIEKEQQEQQAASALKHEVQKREEEIQKLRVQNYSLENGTGQKKGFFAKFFGK